MPFAAATMALDGYGSQLFAKIDPGRLALRPQFNSLLANIMSDLPFDDLRNFDQVFGRL
jgi:hypothetical protein